MSVVTCWVGLSSFVMMMMVPNVWTAIATIITLMMSALSIQAERALYQWCREAICNEYYDCDVARQGYYASMWLQLACLICVVAATVVLALLVSITIGPYSVPVLQTGLLVATVARSALKSIDAIRYLGEFKSSRLNESNMPTTDRAGNDVAGLLELFDTF